MSAEDTHQPPSLEAAWDQFTTTDVSVEAFGRGTEQRRLLGQTPLSRVLHLAYAGDDAEARAAADALAEAVTPWQSPILLQGLVGTAYVGQKRYDDALRVHLTALTLTPRWHPSAAYRALGALADDLVHLGRFVEAVLFAERALAFDPTHPEVLSTLAIASVKTGGQARAQGILRYLEACGYSEAFLGPCRAAVGEPSAAVAAYVPDLATVPILSNEDWLRFLAVNGVNPFSDGEEQRRAHAAACLGQGNLAYAAFASRQAPKWANEDSPIDPAVSRAWGKARQDAIFALEGGAELAAQLAKNDAGPFGEDSDERFTFADEQVEKGEAAPLVPVLADPSRDVVIYVARALLKLGYVAHGPQIEAMAAGEKAMGFDDLPSASKLLSALKKAGGGSKKKAPADKGKTKKAPAKAASKAAKKAASALDAEDNEEIQQQLDELGDLDL